MCFSEEKESGEDAVAAPTVMVITQISVIRGFTSPIEIVDRGGDWGWGGTGTGRAVLKECTVFKPMQRKLIICVSDFSSFLCDATQAPPLRRCFR